MRNLFVKIFLWFWLTVILVGLALVASVLLFNASNRIAVSKAGTVKVTVVFLPPVTVLAGGVFCYVITRHITTPLFRLRSAAGRLAAGDLETRVAPTLGGRRDEIAALARDFDLMADRIGSLLAGHKQLLANVSHELRSPLSRLTVALGLAKKARPAETSEYLDRIALEAHRLDHLIGQLLTLSRIDSGAHDQSSGPIDLTNLVHSVASDADFEARSRSCHVIVTFAAECTVTGSEEVLRSAIENVLRNAIRFSPEHTSVEISLQIEDKIGGRAAVIRVSDRGPGVPDALLDQIFLPFRRVHSPSQGTIEGAGLGLAIAQRAVVLHGGTIHAVNNSGGGLTVEIVLPT